MTIYCSELQKENLITILGDYCYEYGESDCKDYKDCRECVLDNITFIVKENTDND